MIRRGLPTLCKYSPVAIRPVVSASQLAATPRYMPPVRTSLSKKYARVDESTRYESLKLILGRLSSHVGRRQVRMQCDLERHLDTFKRERVDWFVLKDMPRGVRLRFLRNRVRLSESEMLMIQTALDAPICGVLTRGLRRNPGTFCRRPGVREHGWRCGHGDHKTDVYFENQPPMVPDRIIPSPWLESGGAVESRSRSGREPEEILSGQARALAPPSAETERQSQMALWGLDAPDGRERDDQLVDPYINARKRKARGKALEDAMLRDRKLAKEVESAVADPVLNFHLDGRLQHDEHPRVWATPLEPTFVVDAIGFDFYVHPLDPRAQPQVAEAAEDWALHARVVRNVLWERLEEHGVAQAAQPLDLEPGDVPSPDAEVQRLRSVFALHDEAAGVTVERELEAVPGADGGFRAAPTRPPRGGERTERIPWFSPSPPRAEIDGVPAHLPFAPTIAVRSMFRPFPLPPDTPEERRLQALRHPLVELQLLVHPKACVWLPPQAREAVRREVLDYAAKMPFALPWTLYLRVDTAKRHRQEPGLGESKAHRLEATKRFFDPEFYVADYRERLRGLVFQPEDANAPGEASGHVVQGPGLVIDNSELTRRELRRLAEARSERESDTLEVEFEPKQKRKRGTRWASAEEEASGAAKETPPDDDAPFPAASDWR